MSQKNFVLACILFSMTIGVAGHAQTSEHEEDKSTAIFGRKLYDVFVSDKPEGGTIFLANINNGNEEDTKLLWLVDSQMIELATNPKDLSHVNNRDSMQIGLTRTNYVTIPLVFKTGAWSVQISNSPDGSTPTSLTLYKAVGTSGTMRTISFTRPPAPWNRYVQLFNGMSSYVSAFAPKTSTSFPLHHDLATVLSEAEPRGSKVILGLHTSSPVRMYPNNVIFFAPQDSSDPVANLSVLVVTDKGFDVYPTRITSDSGVTFTMNGGTRVTVPRTYLVSSFERAYGRKRETSAFNQTEHTIQNSSADIALSITLKGATAKTLSFSTKGLAAEDLAQIITGNSPLIDSPQHPFFREGHSCGKALGAG